FARVYGRQKAARGRSSDRRPVKSHEWTGAHSSLLLAQVGKPMGAPLKPAFGLSGMKNKPTVEAPDFSPGGPLKPAFGLSGMGAPLKPVFGLSGMKNKPTAEALDFSPGNMARKLTRALAP